jgi:hypothetical protein
MSDADREWTIEHAAQLYDTSACSTTTTQTSRYKDGRDRPDNRRTREWRETFGTRERRANSGGSDASGLASDCVP